MRNPVDRGGFRRRADTKAADVTRSAEATEHEAKTLVRRLVDEAMNGRDLDVLDHLCTSALAPKLRLAFEQFLSAFPDWRQELLELVAEDDTVVARFRCTGTHLGEWQGLTPTGRTMRIDEVYFFHFAEGRLARTWGLEDTWTRMRQLAGNDVTLDELGSLSETKGRR
jgi:predicted ester cyclase